ncbi:MAG: hypothetical protein ACYS32_03965 [Planctomycetota bacterium]|jgi:hypothetical protein
MSEQEKIEHQEIKTAKRISRFFGITSFVLGLFSFVVMLYFWIDLLFDVSYNLYGVFQFLNVDEILLNYIVLILLLLSLPSGFLALVIGFFSYFIIYKEITLSKKLALWGIILSLFYWVLFFIQHTIWIPGYGW